MTEETTLTDPEQRLHELGLELPPPAKALASYVPSVRTGNLLFISGQVPLRDGKPTHTGRVGAEITMAQAQEAARVCVLNGLSVAKDALGSLSKVRQIVRTVGYTHAAPGFTDVHLVANGSSDLLVEIFGERGRHSRLALGAHTLPLNVPFELDLVLEVE